MKITLPNILILFISLIPFALLTGSFLGDFFLSISSILFIYYCLTNKVWKYFNNFFFKIFFCFCIYLICRSLLSSHIYLSLESSLFYFRFGIFSLIIWFLLDYNKKFILYFFYCFIFAYCFALLDGYYQYFNDINLFQISSPGVRMNLLLSDNLILGGYLSRLFPLLIALVLLIDLKKKHYLVLVGILFILTDVLIFISGERTAFLLLMISSIFILIFMKKFRVFRLVTLFISLSLIGIISMIDSDIKERNIDVTYNQLFIDKGEFGKEIVAFTHIHQSHYISAYRMFKDNIFFGHGPKTFRKYCDNIKYNYDEYSCSTHPHNTYLQLLSETGIVGLFFLLIIIAIIIKHLFNHIYSSIFKRQPYLLDYEICLLSCFLITLWPIAPTQNFFGNWISIIYYLPVGFYLYTMTNKKFL